MHPRFLNEAQRLQRSAWRKLEEADAWYEYIYIIIYSISKIELGIAHVLQTRLRMANDMPENKKLEISATSIKSSKWCFLRISLQAFNVGVFAVNLQRWKEQQKPQNGRRGMSCILPIFVSAWHCTRPWHETPRKHWLSFQDEESKVMSTSD